MLEKQINRPNWVIILNEPAYSVLRLMSESPKHLGFSERQHSFLNSIRVSMKCSELNSTYNIRKHATLGGMMLTQSSHILWSERHIIVKIMLIPLKAYAFSIFLNKVHYKCWFLNYGLYLQRLKLSTT
jgi:hypothetical protein